MVVAADAGEERRDRPGGHACRPGDSLQAGERLGPFGDGSEAAALWPGMLPVTISASRTESAALFGLLVARPRLKTAMLDFSYLPYPSRALPRQSE